MKISVITLHRVRNYGSSLQTLATQRFLQKMGCEVEIVDYYPERYSSLGLLKRLKNKSEKLAKNPVLLLGARIIISFSYIKKKIVFDKFLSRYINLTSKTYYSEKDLLGDNLQADAFCTGSDQVWNSHWNEGVDRPFYLSFVPEDAYKFSYAASIGNADLDKKEVEEVLPLLKQYRHITVRENVGVDIIGSMGLEAKQMLDPTLLFKAEEWDNYTSDKYKNKKYVLTYNLHHDKRIDEYARSLAKEYGLETYHISYNVHDIIRKGKLKWCPTVEEYLGLIKNAQYVVTDSFHATVFSILFHTKFMVIYPEQASSRIRSILELLSLNERGSETVPDLELAKREIDFSYADNKLEEERQKSREYLSVVLSEIKKKEV